MLCAYLIDYLMSYGTYQHKGSSNNEGQRVWIMTYLSCCQGVYDMYMLNKYLEKFYLKVEHMHEPVTIKNKIRL